MSSSSKPAPLSRRHSASFPVTQSSLSSLPPRASSQFRFLRHRRLQPSSSAPAPSGSLSVSSSSPSLSAPSSSRSLSQQSTAPHRSRSSFPSLSRSELVSNAASSREFAQATIGSLSGASPGSSAVLGDVWAHLSEVDVPTSSLTAAAADRLPRAEALAFLSPARHLVAAAFGAISDDAVRHLRSFSLQRVKEETRVQYAGHVLNFLRWADDMDVPLHLRFPTPANLLLLFFSSVASFYAESSLNKIVSGLKMWHAVHGLPWALDRVQAKTVAQAFSNLSLEPLDLRRPIRVQDFQAMRDQIQPGDGADVAVYACALFAMWSMARHGELTVRSASAPSPVRARRSDLLRIRDQADGPVKSVLLHVPSEKTHTRTGFDRVASAHPAAPVMCPVAAILWHLSLNPAPDDAGIFAFRDRHGQVSELTSSHFNKTINRWMASAGLAPLKGHALRIGGATLLYSNGVSIEDIKHLGGWGSDVALRYIRDVHVRHAEVCADLSLDALRRPLPE
ncbi:hypothetical protein CF319_g8757 [Tilletia indica]|nr:hypothetical protein CF319_g8757 [Tilletia indica]